MKIKNIVSTICLFSITFYSYCADFWEVYQDAIRNDPTFKIAYDTWMSTSELVPQARSALLPQFLVNASIAGNTLNVNAGNTDGVIAKESYRSEQWSLQASQAIFNYNAWSQLQQAKASIKSAHAIFNSSTQDLILRTAKAYFDVLFAKDNLKFSEAKKRANKRQLDQAQQRFDVGVDTMTSVYEAKAAHDQSIAEVIAAKNNQVNQNQNLSKITHKLYDYLAQLRNNKIPLIKPNPNRVEDWVRASQHQNYRLFAAQYKFESFRENLKAQASGNWPVLNVQGNQSDLRNHVASSNVFIPKEQMSSSIALALNFPVFQGGLTVSKTRQAQYDLQRAADEFEEVYRDITANTHIAYNTIVDGISKVRADRQTVMSQQNSLDSTEAQFEVGTRVMVDVVNAQRKLFEAQVQLASDQYNLIYAILRLKFLAGTLSEKDVMYINSWLQKS